jgi:hypothetical protein
MERSCAVGIPRHKRTFYGVWLGGMERKVGTYNIPRLVFSAVYTGRDYEDDSGMLI